MNSFEKTILIQGTQKSRKNVEKHSGANCKTLATNYNNKDLPLNQADLPQALSLANGEHAFGEGQRRCSPYEMLCHICH